MKDVMNNEEFCVAGMYAWNKLSVLMDGDESVPFDDVETFNEFYSTIIDRLFEEGASE